MNGDSTASFTGELKRSLGENSGRYPITQGLLAATGNYRIGAFIPGILNIDAEAVAQATSPTFTIPTQLMRIISYNTTAAFSTISDQAATAAMPAFVNNTASAFSGFTAHSQSPYPYLSIIRHPPSCMKASGILRHNKQRLIGGISNVAHYCKLITFAGSLQKLLTIVRQGNLIKAHYWEHHSCRYFFFPIHLIFV